MSSYEPYTIPVQQPPNTQQTTYISQPVYVAPATGRNAFSRVPQRMKCPHCNNEITTVVKYQPGLGTWLISGGICLFGLAVAGLTWCGCQFIPFCIDDLKDVHHYCPNCNKVIGTKAAM